jgi:D-3-phosphoglycerate dehydrogenase
MKVAVLDDYQRAVPSLDSFAKLTDHEVTVFDWPAPDEDALAERLQPFEAVVLIRARSRFPASLIERLPQLKLLVQTGNIGPHVDVAACRARGIVVCAKSGPIVSAAELTWTLILASLRNVVEEAGRVRAGLWQGTLGETVAGKRLGLLGYGRIGQLVARYAKAFDAEVTVWGRASTLERARAAGFGTSADMHSLFASCDIVTAHLSLKPETRGIVKLEHLRAMRPNALFVNTSRAELVAPGALEQALQEGRPGRAAVDVYAGEPIWTPEHPLLRNPKVLPTPHIGYVERGTYEVYFGDAFDAVNAFATNQPINVVQ